MNLKTYQARSMAEALQRVKRDLGRGAVILNTRTVTRGGVLGWGARRYVEITAADGAAVAAANGDDGRLQADPACDTRERPPSIVRPATVPPASAPGRMPAAPAPTADSPDVRAELRVMRQMLDRVLSETRAARLPDVPAALVETYTGLLSNQVADDLVRDLVAALTPLAGDPVAVRAALAQRIAAMAPACGPIAARSDGRSYRVALVGPTGTGKTTTLAKLAAHAALRDDRRIGLVTIDTYRIGAVDQLRTYAAILNAPFVAVACPDEMTAALARLADCDLVLIDTAGRGPKDEPRIAELQAMLAAAEPDEVHLVLASTHSEAAAVGAVRGFAPLGADRIVFTKLDEAVGFGTILNVLARVQLRVSYLADGQSVPSDIAPADPARIAELILTRREPDASVRPAIAGESVA